MRCPLIVRPVAALLDDLRVVYASRRKTSSQRLLVYSVADGTHARMLPEVALEEAEMEHLIVNELAALTTTRRRVNETVRTDDLSYQAVVTALSASRWAVSNHVVSANRRIRDALLQHAVATELEMIGRANAVDARAGDSAVRTSSVTEQRVDDAA